MLTVSKKLLLPLVSRYVSKSDRDQFYFCFLKLICFSWLNVIYSLIIQFKDEKRHKYLLSFIF